MRPATCRRFAVFSLLLLSLFAIAQSPVPKKERTAEQKEALAEAQKWSREMASLREAGKLGEAIEAARKVLAAEIKLDGEAHDRPVGTLILIAEMQEELEKFGEAKTTRERVLKAESGRFPKDHWKVTDARVALESLAALAKLNAADRRELALSKKRLAEANAPDQKSDPAVAVRTAEEVLAKRKKLLGENHPDYASGLTGLAAVYQSVQEYEKAEPLYVQAGELRKKALGERHPGYARSLQELGKLYESMMDFARTEPLYLQANNILKEALGEDHPEHVYGLDDLAKLYNAVGEYGRAESLCLQIREIRKRTLGEDHPAYAQSLSNLAQVYETTGEFAKAEPLYLRAREIVKKALGEDHPDYGQILDGIGSLYFSAGEYAKAEPFYLQAKTIRQKALGEDHPTYAQSVHNLALIYDITENYAKAEPLYRQANTIIKKALGEDHPYFAHTLHALGNLYVSTKEYGKAEPLLLQAKELRAKLLGEDHPDFAQSLGTLAGLYRDTKEYAKAEALALREEEITRKSLGEGHPQHAKSLNHLGLLYGSMEQWEKCEKYLLEAVARITTHSERNDEGLSEASQLARTESIRYYLDNLLLGTAGRSSPKVYDAVLRLRGSVTQRQVFLRSIRNAKPELKPLIEQLQRTCSRLSLIATMPPDPKRKADLDAESRKLEEDRQKQEAELARGSDEFAEYLKRKKRSGADLRKMLPEGTVLVEFLQYEKDLCAFVIDRQKVQRVELGKAGPIEAAVDAYRDQLLGEKPNPAAPKGDPRTVLAEKLWQPVAKLLGSPKVVLVCPDGPLCRLPFAALPGSDPKKYLIEELALVTVPVPSLLPDLLAPKTRRGESASLLALGDVDFGKVPADSKRSTITPLPGTAAELTGVVATFRKSAPDAKVTELRQGLASEEWVRRGAGRHSYLHFATHGFFAPAGFGQLVGDADGERGLKLVARTEEKPKPSPNPGLLSGLVCARANDPKGLSGEDGILTALEVQDLDLSRVEMVVLSACETGLGRTAGGEGVLGLQRAFQLAGAKTAVTSLWKVDDEATRVLMTRFYDNFFAKKMGRLDALVEAQKWLMNEGPKNGFTRGLKVVPKKGEASAEKASPYYWAAFVLSGDWR